MLIFNLIDYIFREMLFKLAISTTISYGYLGVV